MKLKFSGDDARDVENVFDDLFLRPRVSFNHFDRMNRAFIIEAAGFNIRDQPITAFKGVRSSCERVARNSSFKRFAFSASARAMRSRTRSWASFFFSSFARGDVALDADVAERFAETAAHGEN